MFTVEKSPPHPALRPFIRSYVQREAHLGAREIVEPVIARLGVMLEFEFAGSYEVRNYGTELRDDTFPISVIGPQTWRRARLIVRNDVESLVVMFQPCGFHALFGVPTAPLSESGTEGHALLGPAVSALHQRLGNTHEFNSRTRLLDAFFLSRLAAASNANASYKALDWLTRPGPLVKVSEAARHMGASTRHLERKSLEWAGVSPKHLTRISRFSRALNLRSSDSALTWTQIAHAAEYHDQMHMIRDFRTFAGEAPTFALEEIAPEHLINFAL
jgi:AraC-like DNA-binding protein